MSILSVVQADHYRAQRIDRQSALQTAGKGNTDGIPFTLTFHPHNHAVKSTILKKLKITRKRFRDWHYLFATPTYFIQTWQKHRQLFGQKFILNQWQTRNFQMRPRSRCRKTCPFIQTYRKFRDPRLRSIRITDHFTCTSANVIYRITCTYWEKLYIGETGRRLGRTDSENTFAS